MSCYVVVPIEQEIESVPSEGYAPYNFPPEGAYLPFFFTDETFTKVLSALVNGAYQTYGDGGMQVIWYFLQNVEFPVSFCSQLIECLETDEDVKDALRNFITTDPGVQQWIEQNIEQNINIGQPLLPETITETIVENDDLARLFGAITFLVDTIHDAIVDFNQDAEASTNSRELGAIIFEALPVIETLPFDQVSDYIDTLYNQIIEVFDSQYDTTPITGTRDRIRCDLFCIALDNDNSLTWELIQTYFYNRTGFTWSQTFNIMLEFANFLQTGTWTGEEVVDIAFGNFAAAMSGMGKFGEMLFPSLSALMQLGQDTPDTDYTILCDCTPPPGNCQDLTFNAYGWYGSNAVGSPSTVYGSWISGQGLAPGAALDFFLTKQSEVGRPNVQSLTFSFNQAVTNFRVARTGNTPIQYSGAVTTSITFSEATHPTFFPVNLANTPISISFQGGKAPSSGFRVVEWCWELV